ncbi:hypothetical protein Moror_10895 [Moniliophthora roreri MCA 2997]|uniref:Protein kinase domain-containing protein n=1 Tax=Moniliophthora roreri (strain MCA 2997) TaxID=1381753 RepID=V2Y8E0_MONRO|nr:hypothetical protein Moror_10895 [Moniliophthora roreri MCA 2997]
MESVGYRLRPRYQPGWVPKLETISEKLRSPLTTYIVWRLVSRTVNVDEVEIDLYFQELADHPRNHCAPIYDVLSVPNDTNLDVIVMPLLRLFDESQFDTVGEVIHFLHQIFEGIQFMHEHHTAHGQHPFPSSNSSVSLNTLRDCTRLNTMMAGDAMYPNSWHPMLPRYQKEDGLELAQRVAEPNTILAQVLSDRFWILAKI